MSTNSNQRKAETLGISHGAANGLLRRNIIHHLLVQYGDHKCFRCGEWILTPEELSIDHIEPWEGRPNGKELYWDLENVAFSHRKCNRPHSYTPPVNAGIALRKIGPEGTAWCSGCKQFMPVEEFSSNKSRWNGLASFCKKCRSESWQNSKIANERHEIGRRASNEKRGRPGKW